MSWGYHLTVDGIGAIGLIRNKEVIEQFARDLVVAINMKAHGDPQVTHFGEDERVSGYTLVQLIETSAITGHFVDQTGEFFIDVFSCKEFDRHIALDLIIKHFEVKDGDYNSTFLVRQAPKR
jgi:S-adenosylmethionine/arginine decarboxylase-like enzyme